MRMLDISIATQNGTADFTSATAASIATCSNLYTTYR